jgi:predicted aminopeptidase
MNAIMQLISKTTNARSAAFALGALLLPGLYGCSNAPYYAQAARGQLSLWKQARPIEEMLADPSTPSALRSQLSTALAIRAYASEELRLPENESYRKYADIHRPYAVWNVYAAPELSVKPKEWCFPVAGCVSYRGYFSEREAELLATRLRGAGFDVYVAGVPAYSTLGWFDDPILSSFADYREEDMAGLIFHELAHQVLYVRDDSIFNESFATTVEVEGVRRWLRRERVPEVCESYEVSRKRRQEFRDLILMYRGRVDALYSSDLDDGVKRSGKQRVFAELRADYDRMKSVWGGYGGYDGWFAQPLNNARLASVNTYGQLVPAFQALLERVGGDLVRFYGVVKSIAQLPKEERAAALVSPGWPQGVSATESLEAKEGGG